MWRDVGWGLAALAALLFLGATVYYGLQTLDKMIEPEKKYIEEGGADHLESINDTELDATVTEDALRSRRKINKNVVPVITVYSVTTEAADDDQGYDDDDVDVDVDVTEQEERRTSSSYLFIPIQYLKDKRSVYKEYKDG